MKTEKIENLGIMLDCSRNAVMKVSEVKKFVDIISKMGYNSLQLYTEDTYEVKDNPYFGYLRGRYSVKELKEIDAYCKQKDIELIPCIQTLAHIKQIFRWKDYLDINDNTDILLANCDKTYKLIEDMFKTISSTFSSKKIHIGMDEAHLVGRGAYTDINGYKDRLTVILEHLNKVCELCEKYGLKPMMWSDMFFRIINNGSYYEKTKTKCPDIKHLIPKNLELVYWDYYHEEKSFYDYMIKKHFKLSDKIGFAGGAWTWCGHIAHNGLSIKNSKAAIKSCLDNGINNAIVTLWGDDGKECSFYSLLPAILCFAEFSKNNFDMKSIKAKFFDMFNIKFNDFMKLDLPDMGPKNKNDSTDPCKYLFYNDLFLGIYDTTVRDGMGAEFRKKANILKRLSETENYGYLFDVESKICSFMEIKAELGKKTRTLYNAKDLEGLKALIPLYKKLPLRLDAVYKAYRNLWYKENKSFGFEISDVRFGGLKQRILNCTQILQDYVDGKVEKIEELEQTLLEPTRLDDNFGKQISKNHWATTVTACTISHNL